MTVSENDKKLGAENKIQAQADFDGPIKKGKRSCTDPLCFLAILALWVSGLGIAFWSYSEGGDPMLLLSPTDYKGRICGYDNKTFPDGENKTLANQWYGTDIIMNGVCITGCPNYTNFEPASKNELICKEDEDILEMPQCLVNGVINPIPSLLAVCGACMYIMDSTELLDHCLPKNLSAVIEVLEANAEVLGFENVIPDNLALSSVADYVEKFGMDVTITWRLILTQGLASSTFLAFLTLYFIRLPAMLSIIIWTSALLTPILFAIGGAFCYLLAQDKLDTVISDTEFADDFDINEERAKWLQISAYVCWGIAVFLLCVLIFLRKRIGLAIGITKASAHAIADMKMTVFYPFLQLIWYILLFIPWILVLAFLASMRQLEADQISFGSAPVGGEILIPFMKWTYEDTIYYLFWYMLFVFFWSSEFIVASGQLTLAISFSRWYFTPRKGAGFAPNLFASMSITFFKHAGTVAYGSLIIAIIRFIRAVLMYVHKKLKNSGTSNKCIDAAMCCCQCCMACVERCLKFINKNAYIQTAIFGYSFCKACREAFFLILRNAARLSAVGLVSTLSIMLCKLVIIAGIGVSSFFLMETLYGDEVWSIVAISIFICLIAYFVVNMFMETIDMAISTLFQCFVADEEMYPEGSAFVPSELDSFLKRINVN